MQKIEDLGAMMLLANQADYYRKLPLGLLMVMFGEPINLNQYRIYEDKDGAPLAAVTWGTLTDEVAEKFATNTYTPQPGEWDAGSNFWFIDFMAPFGGARKVIADLRHNFFNAPEFAAYDKAHSIRPDGRIMTWRKPHAETREEA